MTEARSKPLALVVLLSGNGSNLQAILDAIARKECNAEVCAVISNRADAYGLQRAQAAGIPTLVIDHKLYSRRESFDHELQTRIDAYAPDLVILAGFMRILSDDFVNHYQGRMLNIHPSLLPKFKGLHTHQRALEAGEKEHGASVHYVTCELDGGPVIVQAPVPVLADDTAESLAQRVHHVEHIIYPLAIKWIAEGRLSWHDGQAWLDGLPLHSPHIYSHTYHQLP